jgi:hypothetical protein
MFWAGNKVGCSSLFELWPWPWPLEALHYGHPNREAAIVHGQRFGLWAWPLEAPHYIWPKAPIPIFHQPFSAHFFGLSTKFGRSIPWPLNLDDHSVKKPLSIVFRVTNSICLARCYL